MRATPGGLADELKVSPEAFREAFDEVLSKGLAQYDAEASCVWLPNFLKYQSAESPNVIINWVKQVEFIPECQLRTLAVARLQAYAEGSSKAFAQAFREALAKGFPESVSSKQLAVSKSKAPSQRGESKPIVVGIQGQEVGYDF